MRRRWCRRLGVVGCPLGPEANVRVPASVAVAAQGGVSCRRCRLHMLLPHGRYRRLLLLLILHLEVEIAARRSQSAALNVARSRFRTTT